MNVCNNRSSNSITCEYNLCRQGEEKGKKG